jgi:hypothetical protein
VRFGVGVQGHFFIAGNFAVIIDKRHSFHLTKIDQVVLVLKVSQLLYVDRLYL